MTKEEITGDRKALLSLRLSMARVAQALGMALDELPGKPQGWELEHLLKATTEEHGWHKLAAAMVDLILTRTQR